MGEEGGGERVAASLRGGGVHVAAKFGGWGRGGPQGEGEGACMRLLVVEGGGWRGGQQGEGMGACMRLLLVERGGWRGGLEGGGGRCGGGHYLQEAEEGCGGREHAI